MQIPLIDPTSLNHSEVDNLMYIGFCYVQLPHHRIIQQIQKCVEIGREFFLRSTSEKEKWKLKEELNPGDRYQGYALRSQSINTNAIEQFFFEPDAPFGPYESHSSIIQEINDCFMHAISLPLIRIIFERLGFTHSNFIEATTSPNCSLIFQSCPRINDHRNSVRLNAHKDFGLITVLYIEETGLEVKYQNNWHAIPPQKGSVVVNLGNALELMTGGRCHSALHRVNNAPDNRMSTVYFVNPNYQQPVKNYVDNSIVASTGELFFKQQFSDYYQVDH